MGRSFRAVAAVAAHDLATLSHRRGSTIVLLAPRLDPMTPDELICAATGAFDWHQLQC